MTDTTTITNPEPLPWETPEWIATHPTTEEIAGDGRDGNLDINSTQNEFNCGNPECKNRVPTPTFCSEECRNQVYNPTVHHHKHWTLKEMQDWCREKAKEARSRPLVVPVQETIVNYEAAKDIFK